MRYQTTLRPEASIVVLSAFFSYPLPDDYPDRVAGEVELLPQPALDEPLPGNRQDRAGEQDEGGRGSFRLGGVQNLCVLAADARGRSALLGLVDQVVQGRGRDPALSGLKNVVDLREDLAHSP